MLFITLQDENIYMYIVFHDITWHRRGAQYHPVESRLSDNSGVKSQLNKIIILFITVVGITFAFFPPCVTKMMRKIDDTCTQSEKYGLYHSCT